MAKKKREFTKKDAQLAVYLFVLRQSHLNYDSVVQMLETSPFFDCQNVRFWREYLARFRTLDVSINAYDFEHRAEVIFDVSSHRGSYALGYSKIEIEEMKKGLMSTIQKHVASMLKEIPADWRDEPGFSISALDDYSRVDIATTW